MLQPLLGLQIPFNHHVQRLVEVCSRSERCLMQRNSRIRLFLSRATDYIVTLPERTRFNRRIVRGHLCIAGAEVTIKMSTKIRGEISLLLVITVMTAVECLLLRGVVHMCPGTMTMGARLAMSRILGSTRGMSSHRGGSTGAGQTGMIMVGTIRVEAMPLSLAPSVSAEPFVLLRFPPTSGWRLE